MRNSGSTTWCIGRGCEAMIGYMAVRNQAIESIYKPSERVSESTSWERYSVYFLGMIRWDDVHVPQGLPNIDSPLLSPSPLPRNLCTPSTTESISIHPGLAYLSCWIPSDMLSDSCGKKQIFQPQHQYLNISIMIGKKLLKQILLSM